MGNRVLLKDLQPGTLYFLQFQAKNEAVGMYSQWSNIFELLTIADVTPPLPVDNLVWESNGTAFRATWTAPQYSEDGSLALDLAGYEVTVWAPADGAVVGLPVPQGPTRKAVYKTISPNFDFTFEQNVNAFDYPRGKVTIEVRAFDVTGNMSQPTIATAQNPVPATVSGFDAVGGFDQIQFTWAKNAAPPDDDIKFYRIRQGLSAPAINTIIAEVNDLTNVWQTINTATQYFSITAVDVFYQESAVRAEDSAAARSSLEIDVTAPGSPTTVATTSGIDTSDPSNSRVYIDVTWVKPADTDLQEYTIRYSPTGTNWQYLTVPAEDSAGAAIQAARIFGLVAGQSYYVAVRASDFTANVSPWINSATYPQTTAKDTTAPATPAAPSVAVNVGGTQIQVSHTLKDSGGTNNLATDLHHLEVYASTTSNFTAATANKVGDMEIVPPPAGTTGTVTAIQNFTVIPTAGATTQTWYVKVIAVDNAGNKSAASAQNSGSVPLMSAVAIADATITDAKIGTLSANKITAGTGFINDITVKSKFTMGDASTNGIIESFDYIGGGTTGWRIEKGAFTVNNGTIAARALRLQDGQNLLHPAYADFEWATSWYTGKLEILNAATISVVATQFKYGVSPTVGQSVRMQWTGASGTERGFALAPLLDSYNFTVDDTLVYTISFFVKNGTTTPGTIRFGTRHSPNGLYQNNTLVSDVVPSSAAGWTRISGTYIPVAGQTAATFYINSTDGTFDYYIDGVQVEVRRTGETLPSPWTPPSLTRVDGGDIRTGSISSSAASDGVAGQPAWSINTQGGAQLGNVNVRGTLYVGPTGTNESTSSARSGVYTANTSGWLIRGDGYAEFNNVLVRGNIQATSGTFTNTITVGDSASSAHHVRSVNHSYSSTGWIIRGDGYAEFNNVRVVGDVYANNGYFNGSISGASGTFTGNLSGSTITGGTISGATVLTRASGNRIEMNSAAYNKINFWSQIGEGVPADIRVGEHAADNYIQIYSADFGGGRSHISVGGAYGGNPNEIDLVAPSGTLFTSATSTRFTSNTISVEAATNGLSIHNLAAGSARLLCLNSLGGGNIVQVGTSARRKKKNIIPLDTSIEQIRTLTPVWYEWNNDLDSVHDPAGGRHAGFIADEVEEVIPEAAYYDEDEDGVARIADFEDRAVLAHAYLMINDLYAKVEALTAQLEARA